MGRTVEKEVSSFFMMNITGSIKYVNLSGGFWGIEADNGQKYQPVEKLPAQLRQEGLRA